MAEPLYTDLVMGGSAEADGADTAVNGSMEGCSNSTIFWEPAVPAVIVISLFYCAISLTAVLGNSTVILIVITSRRMQSVTNFFIANLALADVIIGLFAIPFQFQAALLQRWNLPTFLCPFCPFFQNLSVNASIFTLTAIAVDRYKAIMFPLKSHASKSRTKGVIVIIWVASTILAIPNAIAFRTVDVFALGGGMEANMTDMSNMTGSTGPFMERIPFLPDGEMETELQCVPKNIEPIYFLWYKNCMCLVQYFIPLIIISGAYCRMALALWSAETPGSAQLERDRVMTNNKKKVIKMLMMVVALFTLAWLPLQLYDVLNQIFPQINCYAYIKLVWFGIHCLAMSNSCYNPFIYLLLNDKFQKELKLKLACCFGPNRAMRTGDTFRRRTDVITQFTEVNTVQGNIAPKNNNCSCQPSPKDEASIELSQLIKT